MHTNNQFQGLLPALGSAADGLMTLSRWLLPYAARAGWQALDGVIAAALWMFDAGYRFRDWCDDPHNKERVNQTADAISDYANRAFDGWCWAIAATIEAGYRSRPYGDGAIAWGRAQADHLLVLARFLLGLWGWLQRLDFEEVEQYQVALPYSPPVALLAPDKGAIAAAPTQTKPKTTRGKKAKEGRGQPAAIAP